MRTAAQKTLIGVSCFLLATLLMHAQTWTTIDFPTGNGTLYVAGINSLGQMVGAYLDTNFNVHGFLDDHGTFTTIDYPGSDQTFVLDINDLGQMVGYYYSPTTPQQGFFYDGHTYKTILPPSAFTSTVNKMNQSGQMVGTYTNTNTTQSGFVYDANTSAFTLFNFPNSSTACGVAINDSLDVIMRQQCPTGASSDLIRTTIGTYIPVSYPGAASTNSMAINNTREVVGSVFSMGRVTYGFVFHQQKYSRINFPGARVTEARGVDGAGDIVGDYEDSGGVFHGFLRTP